VVIQAPQDQAPQDQAPQDQAPLSVVDLLLSLAAESKKGKGFGFELSAAEQIAYQFQYDYATRLTDNGKKPSWAKYSCSQRDEYGPEGNDPAYKEAKDSVLTESIIRPVSVDVEGANRDPKKKAKLEQACAALELAGLLLRDGRVSIGHVLLVCQANNARFKSQSMIRNAVQDVMPGVKNRFHDNGDLEIDPSQKLQPNALSKALADRADYDIKSQSELNAPTGEDAAETK
jgi:hypothetical protein